MARTANRRAATMLAGRAAGILVVVSGAMRLLLSERELHPSFAAEWTAGRTHREASGRERVAVEVVPGPSNTESR
jgi:hypothetical protein